MKLPSIHTLEGRRSWAFIATVGGCIAFTLIIIASLWSLRNHPAFMFWLALAAHIQVFIGTGALGWVMGRRMTSSVTRDGASFDDRPQGSE
jgi:hypothetical protein